MEQNKYLKPHSLIRMFAALIALVVFISLFVGKQIVHSDFEDVYYVWTEVFFGGDYCKPTVVGFIGYLFVFIGGLAGLAFVFIDEMIGEDLTKKLAFVAGALMVLGGIMILMTGVLFRTINKPKHGDLNAFRLAAGPIVFGILGIVAGCGNVAAPILEDKGF